MAVRFDFYLPQVSSDRDPHASDPPDGDPRHEEGDDDDDLPPPQVAPWWWEEFGTDFDDDEPQPEPGDFWPEDSDGDDRCEARPRTLPIPLTVVALPSHAANLLHASRGALA